LTLIDLSSINDSCDDIPHCLKEIHDISHVLTGCGIDGFSELGRRNFQRELVTGLVIGRKLERGWNHPLSFEVRGRCHAIGCIAESSHEAM